MICIDGYALSFQTATGIHRNTFEMLKELDNIVEPNTLEVVVPNDLNLGFEFKNIVVTKLKAMKMRRLRPIVFNNVTFKKYVKKNKRVSMDLLLSFPSFGCDIIMVYDTIPELFPCNFITWKNKLWKHMFLKRQKKSIKKASLILTDSNSAKSDIEKFYPSSKGKIEVVYCGWQHMLNVKEDESIIQRLSLEKGNYFFSLGSRFVHKNVKWVVSAAKQNPNEKFVVSGRKTKNDDGGEDVANIVYTGYLSDEEIKALMHYCKAFIQPSMYEGFGLPPIEAMSVGARCIVSNVASLPEIYGNSVWYIDPLKYEPIDLKSIMSTKIEDNQKVLDRFSWKESAKKLYSLLKTFQERKEK